MPQSPLASEPICLSKAMMEVAKDEPLMSSYQKKPVKIVKRTNSAKNSPLPARHSAIRLNAQIMLITTRSQNSQLAR